LTIILNIFWPTPYDSALDLAEKHKQYDDYLKQLSNHLKYDFNNVVVKSEKESGLNGYT
jgi:hypothetical protein